jgi:hypothetical protein
MAGEDTTSPANSLGPRALEVECKVLRGYESNLAQAHASRQNLDAAVVSAAARVSSGAYWAAIECWTARNGRSNVRYNQTTEQ